MKTKEEIVANWLPRYTKRKLEDFGEYILLTNFNKYVEIFAERFNVPILGRDANMISAHAEGMTIINFGMGSPNAAIIMDLRRFSSRRISSSFMSSKTNSNCFWAFLF